MFVKKTNTLWHCITISFQITAKSEQQLTSSPDLKCHRLFRPQFSKFYPSFFSQIREVSNILTPNAGVSDYTPV